MSISKIVTSAIMVDAVDLVMGGGDMLHARAGRKIALILVLIVVLSGCFSRIPKRQVRLRHVEPVLAHSVTDGRVEKALKVAAAPLVSPQTTLQTYAELFHYIEAKLGRPVEIIQRRTYSEINDLVRAGTVDLALVCSFAYVLGNREYGMELVAMPVIKGRAEYYSYVIARADAGLRTMEELRGKSFAFTDPLSTSGRLSPEGILKEMGTTPEQFFSHLIFTFSHDNSIRAVDERVIDGAAVDSLVFDSLIASDPELGGRLKVLNRDGPFGSPPFVVNPGLDDTVKQQLKEILTSMHLDTDGRRVLTNMGVDHFIPGDDAAFDSVRRLADRVRPQP